MKNKYKSMTKINKCEKCGGRAAVVLYDTFFHDIECEICGYRLKGKDRNLFNLIDSWNKLNKEN